MTTNPKHTCSGLYGTLTLMAACALLVLVNDCQAAGVRTNLKNTSVTLSSNYAGSLVTYTFSAKTKNRSGSDIALGNSVNLVFPAGSDASGVSSVTFAGVPVPPGDLSLTSNTISFPAPASVGKNSLFLTVVSGVRNPSLPKAYAASMVTGNSSGGTNNAINKFAYSIVAGVPTRLVYEVQPSNSAAGASIFPAVKLTVQDDAGNTVGTATHSISLSIGNNPGGASLNGATTVNAINGVALFTNVSLDKTGTGYTLVASSTGLPSVTSASFNVDASTAWRLSFKVHPFNTIAGQQIAPALEVEIYDSYGNLVPGATDSVTLAIGNNPGGGTLSGTTTVQALNGVASFNSLSIEKAAVGYTLTASGTNLLSATSNTFSIQAGAPVKLGFLVQPSDSTAGDNNLPNPIFPAVEVAVQDTFGNTVTGAVNSISIGLGNNPVGGTLFGGTSANAASGVSAFNDLSINKAGAGYTLLAVAAGLTGAESVAFSILPDFEESLAFIVQPANAFTCASILPAVKVVTQDGLGNIVTSSNLTISLALAGGTAGAVLNGSATLDALNGVASFGDLNVSLAGSGYTLLASSPFLIGATSSPFSVADSTLNRLFFTSQPASTTAGQTLAIVRVEIRDPFGALTSATDSITLGLGDNPGGGSLSGTTSVSAINGVAEFNALALEKAGSGYTLIASGVGLLGTTSNNFNITAAAPSTLAFLAQPQPALAGAGLAQIEVGVVDPYGNLIRGATDHIVLSIANNPSGSTLSGAAGQDAAAGVAKFNGLSIDKVGAGYTLAASATGLIGATSLPFNIAASAPASVKFSLQPVDTAAGLVLGPVEVSVYDAYGNLVSTGSHSVTLALGSNAAGADLSGTLSVSSLNGVASFNNLALNKVGAGYTLVATSMGLASASSAAFSITDTLAPSLLSLSTPLTGTVGESLAMTALFADAQSITYSWNFGDGTTPAAAGSSTSHIYSAAGDYIVSIIATDAGGLSSSASINAHIVAAVLPPTQVAPPVDPVLPPEQPAAKAALAVKQLLAKLKFPSSLRKDSLALKANLQLGDGFVVAGATLEWNIAGISGTTTLDARGKSPISSAIKVALKYKKPRKGEAFTARTGQLWIMLRGQSLDKLSLAGVGVLNQTTPAPIPASSNVEVSIRNHNQYALSSATGTYKSKQDSSGQFLIRTK